MTNPIKMPEIEEIKVLAGKATMAPWSWDEDETEIHSDVWSEGNGDPYHIVRGDGSVKTEDGRFIACANPDKILSLIATLEKAVESIRETVAYADDHGDSFISSPVRDFLKEISG